MLLEIRDLRAAVDGKEILSGLDLAVAEGEVHAIMGPNGSGKSTLAQVLAGHPAYQVTAGEVLYQGKNLLDWPPEKRAREGVFLAFQYPVEIPGVANAYFLRAGLNEIRAHRGLEELDAMEFLALLKEKLKIVEMDPAMMSRAVNEGFSGGEKKRNEILQMAVLEPKLAILDETDSGLDIDALRIVASGVQKLRRPDNATILVTHYQRLLNYITPDRVHVLYQGRIVKSGGKELAIELEARGLRLDSQRGDRVNGTEPFVEDYRRFVTDRASAAPSWLGALRETAMARFAASGFPTTREEDWKYTNVAPLVSVGFRPAFDARGSAYGAVPSLLGGAREPRVWSS